VSGREALEPLNDSRPGKPFLDGIGANLKEYTFTAILNRGNHCGSSAICARTTSVSYSPLMSGVTASKRVNPMSARISRNR